MSVSILPLTPSKGGMPCIVEFEQDCPIPVKPMAPEPSIKLSAIYRSQIAAHGLEFRNFPDSTQI